MKLCGYCGAENEDPYLLCVGCNEELPRKEKLAAMLTAAETHLRKCEFREAYRAADKLLALNKGARMAWLIRGIAARELRMAKHSMECFVNAGLDYEREFCKECKGSGQCRHCGEEGKCFMCGGIGYCSIFHPVLWCALTNVGQSTSVSGDIQPVQGEQRSSFQAFDYSEGNIIRYSASPGGPVDI